MLHIIGWQTHNNTSKIEIASNGFLPIGFDVCVECPISKLHRHFLVSISMYISNIAGASIGFWLSISVYKSNIKIALIDFWLSISICISNI